MTFPCFPPSTLLANFRRCVGTMAALVCSALSVASAADLVLSDDFDVAGGNSPGTGFGANGVNYEIDSRLSGNAFTQNPGMTLLRTGTDKAASNYSITGNQLRIADATGVGTFQYSADGVTAFNFGSFLEGQTYEISLTMTLGELDNTSRRMSFYLADEANTSGGVGGANYGFQLVSNSASGGTMSVYERLSASANSGSIAINQEVASGLAFNQPVVMRLVITDSFNYSPGVYDSTYELFVNDVSVSAGNFRFDDGDRYLVFDVAPNAGPASYDNFLLTSTGGGAIGIVNWDGATGPYSTSDNWSGDTLPGNSATANIANSGVAQVGTGDTLLVNELWVGNGSSANGATVGTGQFEMTDGSLRVTKQLTVGRAGASGTANVSGGLLSPGLVVVGDGAGADGELHIGGTAQLITSPTTGVTDEIQVGANGGTGRLTVSDSAEVTSQQGLLVGVGAGSNGTVELSGVSTSRFSQTSQIGAGGMGAMAVTGGASAIFDQALHVGNTSTGVLNIESDGYVAVNGWIAIGRSGGHGTVNLKGGSLVHTGTSGITMAAVGSGNTGVLNHTGGVLINDQSQFWIGEDNTATVNASGGQAYLAIVRIGYRAGSNGTLNLSGTADYTATNVFLSSNGAASGGTGVLNLNGGKLRANSIQEGPGDAGTVNFNGGTVVARTVSANYFAGFESSDLRLLSDGLVFDSDGYSVTISQGFSGDGSLTKTGKGTLTLTGLHTYEGDTLIEDGTLAMTQAFLFDQANVHLTTDGTLNLSTAGATDTIHALFIDGVAQDTGTWGGIGSGAMHESGLITGNGTLLVTSAVPEPSTVTLIVLGAGISAFLRHRRKRTDRSAST